MRLGVLVGALAFLVLSGCGGNDRVPEDAIAVIDGQEIPKSEFDAVIAQARRSHKNQRGEFPKAGSQELETLKNQVVQFLVQRVQFERQAKDLNIEVSDTQVNARLDQIRKQYFGGDKKKYEAQLKEQGLTDKQVRADIRSQLLTERIFKQVTGDVKVTDKQIEDYYTKNKAQYSQPQSREVRHILVKTKAKADDIYSQLKAGADFATLAKKFSEDTGSKANGGKLTISKGQTVAPFDQTAFLLKKNAISKPVKTEFGYHVIQPLGDVKEAKVTPLKEVKESISKQLAQTKKNEAMTKWITETNEEFKKSTRYQEGFEPPAKATTGVTLEIETTP